MSGGFHVAVAGGGLGGLACAKYLADAGVKVTVVESLPYLGGRASTFRDGDGEWVEQGLHLFLGAYTEFKALLSGIGCDPNDVLFWMDELYLQDPEGPQARFGVNPLYAPLRTILGALGNNDYLGPLDKLSLAALNAPGLLGIQLLRERYDDLTIAEWWRRLKGTDDAMERLIRPFCRAIQFTDAEQFSAYDFLGWIHQVVYRLPHHRLGGYRGARDEIIFRPLGEWLYRHGCEIRTGVEIERIEFAGSPLRAASLVCRGGERIEADAVVAAVPAWKLAALLPDAVRREKFFQEIETLPIAPAISVQAWFDRPVADTPAFTLVARSHAPVYQEQSMRTYPVAQGQRISVIVSPADQLLGWDESRILQSTLDSLGQAHPPIAEARVTKSVVLKHPQHLVRPLPGAMSRRPTQETPIANFFLAGDWTQQDFFGSQEGAVRGGKLCAERLLAGKAAT